ncbi:hypothetical protein LTR08_002252 [Meristemomyces frigidus]|nr:hypothetical protein LTR08_002252 [Meristemomyces frigidus]
MPIPLARQSFYLRLYDVLHARPCPARCLRAVSTTSAINRGVYASRAAGGGGGARDRGQSFGRASEDRDGGRGSERGARGGVGREGGARAGFARRPEASAFGRAREEGRGGGEERARPARHGAGREREADAFDRPRRADASGFKEGGRDRTSSYGDKARERSSGYGDQPRERSSSFADRPREGSGGFAERPRERSSSFANRPREGSGGFSDRARERSSSYADSPKPTRRDGDRDARPRRDDDGDARSYSSPGRDRNADAPRERRSSTDDAPRERRSSYADSDSRPQRPDSFGSRDAGRDRGAGRDRPSSASFSPRERSGSYADKPRDRDRASSNYADSSRASERRERDTEAYPPRPERSQTSSLRDGGRERGGSFLPARESYSDRRQDSSRLSRGPGPMRIPDRDADAPPRARHSDDRPRRDERDGAAAPTRPRRGATPTTEQDAIWTDIRRLGELIQDLREAEHMEPETRPTSLISEATLTIKKVNAEMQRLGASEERRERVFYLQRRLSGLSAYAKEGSVRPGAAEHAVVVEKLDGNSFELVLKGAEIGAGMYARERDGGGARSVNKRSQPSDGEPKVTEADEQSFKNNVQSIHALLTTLKASQPTPPLPEQTTHLHALLTSLGAFAPFSTSEWKRRQALWAADVLERGTADTDTTHSSSSDHHQFLLRRRGDASDVSSIVVGLLSKSEHPRLELIFNAGGVLEGGWADHVVSPKVDLTALDEAEVEQVRKDVRRVRSLVLAIRAAEASSSSADDALGVEARASLVQEASGLVAKMNALARTPASKWGIFVRKRFYQALGGMAEVYRKKGVLGGAAGGTMVRELEGDLHELVVGEVSGGGEEGSGRGSGDVGRVEPTVAANAREVKDDDVAPSAPARVDSRDTSDRPPAPRAADTSAARATTGPPPSTLPTQSRPVDNDDDDGDIPVSIPYTTAASHFLYGANVALAALRARKRKLYHLHLSPRAYNRDTGNAQLLIDLARKAGVAIEPDANPRLMDKMADGRVHNGVVLEVSRVPAPPVLSLAAFAGELEEGKKGGGREREDKGISLVLERQSKEDAAVNGTAATIARAARGRYPLVLMLDGITDPGNLGNILRTAHFYGVDAVAVATNTCAPLHSPVVAKASSGACEAVPLLALPKPSNFVFESARAGWRVFAAVAPEARGSSARGGSGSGRGGGEVAAERMSTVELAEEGPLARGPCILMLGAEGEGLRANLTAKAGVWVGVAGGTGEGGVDVGVDSLNVGVAAGGVLGGVFWGGGCGGGGG